MDGRGTVEGGLPDGRDGEVDTLIMLIARALSTLRGQLAAPSSSKSSWKDQGRSRYKVHRYEFINIALVFLSLSGKSLDHRKLPKVRDDIRFNTRLVIMYATPVPHIDLSTLKVC